MTAPLSPIRAALACLVLLVAFVPARADYEAAARYSAENRGISFLVMVDGRIVAEDYPTENTPRRITPGPDFAFELASGTKSFSGVMAAAAVQDGLLSLDEEVSATLTEWRDDPERRDITIRDLLSLTGGIPGRTRRWGRVPAYADAIKAEAKTPRGEKFSYGPIPFQIFGEVMRRKLAAAPDKAETVEAYLKRRILDPLEIAPARWRTDRDGNPHLPSGMALTAREWARFGEFVRLGGVWQGRQLVDRAALEAGFVGTPANPAYGLTWWLNNPVDPALRRTIPVLTRASDILDGAAVPDDLIMAAGAGNQRLYISRSRRMVVVRQSHGILKSLWGNNGDFSDAEFWRRLLAE